VYRGFLILILACATVFITACTQTDPGKGTYGVYSDTFYRWFYPTNEIAIDISNLRLEAEGAREDLVHERLQQLANRQAEQNRLLINVKAPAEWSEFHNQITAAIRAYDDSTAEIRFSAAAGDINALAARLDEEQIRLIERVSVCYAHAMICR